MMQCPPVAWGWTGSQHWSGDEGVGAAVVEGSALMRDTPAPPMPPSATTSAAVPPAAAAIVLAERLAMTLILDLCAPRVQGLRREAVRARARVTGAGHTAGTQRQ